MDNNGDKNPNWKGGISKKEFTCINCGSKFYGHHSRKAKYCSNDCKNKYIKTNNLNSLEKHPRWIEGYRIKKCNGCGCDIIWKSPKPYSQFLKQKYCTKECADKNGIRYSGEEHWKFNPNKTQRDKVKQSEWSNEVLVRDNYTCQDCGQYGGDLHAHHIVSYKDCEELRWELSNGKTLCLKCHYKTYKCLDDNENRVNSGKVQKG